MCFKDADSNNDNYHAKADDNTQTEGFEQSMAVEFIGKSTKISNIVSIISNSKYELPPTYKTDVHQYNALTS